MQRGIRYDRITFNVRRSGGGTDAFNLMKLTGFLLELLTKPNKIVFRKR
jgi:hypothetical protein